jgi:hypothetical protein
MNPYAYPHKDSFWPGLDFERSVEHRQYSVRVRAATKYLWGSAGIANNASYASPPILHIRNDIEGEQVTFGTETADGTQTTIGTLQPGETFSVVIQDIRGVFATASPTGSEVSCFLRT